MNRRIVTLSAIALIFTMASALALIPAVTADSNAPLVNVTMHITNDIDSGYCGNWAIDNFNAQVSIHSTAQTNQYLVETHVEGQFTTIPSAASPGQCIANAETGASGTFQGTYYFTVTGTLNTEAQTNGFIGTFNGAFYGSFMPIYFGSNLPQGNPSAYSFVYHYQGQTWVDSSSVSQAQSGDIVA